MNNDFETEERTRPIPVETLEQCAAYWAKLLESRQPDRPVQAMEEQQ